MSIFEDNEMILIDRLEVIKQVVNEYGEEHCYISFSGGKDSTVVSELFDLAIPNNKIKRVFSDTGIEYTSIRDFVLDKAKNDDRIVILKPKKNIVKCLEEDGYPFKSKLHSKYVDIYQRLGMRTSVLRYVEKRDKNSEYNCPNILQYQFTDECKLKISDKCCDNLKKSAIKEFKKTGDYKCQVLGLMQEEGGRRKFANCKTTFSWGITFSPLAKVSKEWEDWFINEYNIKLASVYYPPYNFKRTGCKGCPYALTLERDLEIMRDLMPNDYKQCWHIFGKVYDEYLRIGYRLHKNYQTELIFEGEKNDE